MLRTKNELDGILGKKLREMCEGKNLKIVYTKSKLINKDSSLLVKSKIGEGEARLFFLTSFSEMTASCNINLSKCSAQFLDDCLFILDYIAKATLSEVLLLTLVSNDEDILYKKGFVKWGGLSQFKTLTKIYSNARLNPKVPAHKYGMSPFRRRIRIHNNITQLLDKINGNTGYIINHYIGEINIYFEQDNPGKHIAVLSNGRSIYKIRYGGNQTGEPLEEIFTETELMDFISKFAAEELTA